MDDDDLRRLAGSAEESVKLRATGQLSHGRAVVLLAERAGQRPVRLREAVPLVQSDDAVALLHEAAMEIEDAAAR